MSRRTVLPAPWATLADAYGGVTPLAKALGVSPSTVWRWGQGATIRGPAVLAIASVARKVRVPSPVRP